MLTNAAIYTRVHCTPTTYPLWWISNKFRVMIEVCCLRWNYWETSRRVHNNNNQFVSMFGADHHDLEPDIEYSTPSTRSMIWCRIIATIFLGLIVLRHTLQVILILSETEEYSLTVFMLLLLGILGILISIHTMIKANYYGPRTSTPGYNICS
ncbi:hypothetical protein AHAS_Ahas14G0267000 [Arachis hypogaea]